MVRSVVRIGLLWHVLAFALSSSSPADEPLARREWQVNDVAREALLFVPSSAKSKPTPVIFAFHGHGGTMAQAARMFDYERHWPEAIVVYMQGLKTPGRLIDQEGKETGWQHDLGEQEDRDLKFFDALLSSLKEDYQVDANRVYATGHSNGGSFTYLLWAGRRDQLAAIAPSASIPVPGIRTKLKPMPVMLVAGKKDDLVKFAWQSLAMGAIRKLNGCEEDGSTYAPNCIIYKSPGGTPVVTRITDGTHKFDPACPH